MCAGSEEALRPGPEVEIHAGHAQRLFDFVIYPLDVTASLMLRDSLFLVQSKHSGYVSPLANRVSWRIESSSALIGRSSLESAGDEQRRGNAAFDAPAADVEAM